MQLIKRWIKRRKTTLELKGEIRKLEDKVDELETLRQNYWDTENMWDARYEAVADRMETLYNDEKAKSDELRMRFLAMYEATKTTREDTK